MPGIAWSRVADVAVVAACAVVGAAMGLAVQGTPTVGQDDVRLAVDLSAGAVACLLLWWRRDRPVLVGLLTAVCDVVSFAGTPAYLVAVFAVAVRRPPRVVALVAVAHLVAIVAGSLIDPSPDDPLWQVVLTSALVLGLVAATGLYAGVRQALVVSLRERAARLERDRDRDLAAARAIERTRIAGEVHDVLAHRISLISLHAGGLQVTATGDPRTVEVAELIGTTARAAMADVRDVIGLLRDEHDGERRPPAPQPTLEAVPELVDASRQAGLPVELHLDVAEADRGACPPAAGRHVYRVVQESLTNVHKHTDHAATTVRVSGTPGGRICVEVASGLVPPVADARADAGGGRGLVGLHERITRAGGTFSSGRTIGPDGGRFVVRAELRWP